MDSLKTLVLILYIMVCLVVILGQENSDYGCQQPYLYLTNSTHIMAVDMNLTHKPRVIVSNLNEAMALDVHVKHGMIFWSDISDKSISRANINGSNIEIIVKNNIGVCGGLAVEWVNDLLYWTDDTNNKIEVARLDGSGRKVLFSENLYEPVDIAVDPKYGLMFWTDWGSTPKIERASLKGENRQTIVNSSLGWPCGISLDFDNQTIYWVDELLHVIESVGYDGSSRHKHFSFLSDVRPFSLAMWDQWFYWADWVTTSLRQLNRLSNHMRQLRIDGKVMNLALYDNSRQSSDVIKCAALKTSGVLQKTSCSADYRGTCNFTCPYGYRLVGKTTLNCLATGLWDSQMPTCKNRKGILSGLPEQWGNAIMLFYTDIVGSLYQSIRSNIT